MKGAATVPPGRSVHGQEWTEAELRVLKRYLRKLYTGRGLTVRSAALACSRELAGRRSVEAAREQLKSLVEKTRLPRFHGFSPPEERKLLERYALRVAAGEFGSWREGAEAYRNALLRRRARLSCSASKWPRRTYVRDLDTLTIDLVHAGRRLGLREPRYVRWTEEEDRLVEGWRRWYRRYRHVRRLKPYTQASEGLQQDLAAKGFRRSLQACSIRLTAKPRE